MGRWLGSIGALAAMAACGGDPHVPTTSAAPLEVPPMPVAEPITRFEKRATAPPVTTHPCDERDPTPNAMPASPPPAAFTRIDAEIRRLQSQPGKFVYRGNVEDVIGGGAGKTGAFQRDATEATALGRRLEIEVVALGSSPEWAVVAYTREAEMWERLRDGLARVQAHVGPGPAAVGEIELFTPDQKKLLATMHASGLVPPNDPYGAMNDYWNRKKQQELDALEARIVDRYARAANSVRTKNPAATRAVRRLAHYTSELGDEKMARILGSDYAPGLYRTACAALDD